MSIDQMVEVAIELFIRFGLVALVMLVGWAIIVVLAFISTKIFKEIK